MCPTVPPGTVGHPESTKIGDNNLKLTTDELY